MGLICKWGRNLGMFRVLSWVTTETVVVWIVFPPEPEDGILESV